MNVAPNNLDVGKITQKIKGLPSGSWQSPWDEKYLDEQGEKVIGDYFSVPTDSPTTRLIFYFHFLNFEKNLLTQFGEVKLIKPTTIPDRLKGITSYEEPD